VHTELCQGPSSTAAQVACNQPNAPRCSAASSPHSALHHPPHTLEQRLVSNTHYANTVSKHKRLLLGGLQGPHTLQPPSWLCTVGLRARHAVVHQTPLQVPSLHMQAQLPLPRSCTWLAAGSSWGVHTCQQPHMAAQTHVCTQQCG
jgi:hypothetical protein